MISAGHLKACITSNEKFDFLEEIVQGVPDLPAADEAKLATTKTAKRERAAPNPAVPGSLDDDDYGAPPPMKVMRAEAPGTLDEEAPAVGSLGGDDLDVPVAAPPAVGAAAGGAKPGYGAVDGLYDYGSRFGSALKRIHAVSRSGLGARACGVKTLRDYGGPPSTPCTDANSKQRQSKVRP